MRYRRKSQPGDELIAQDPTADPVDRGIAISNLTYDGFYELEPMMAELLHHPSYFLRAEMVKSLVGVWKKSEYLPEAIRLLHTDPDWHTRADAAFALSMFTWQSGEERETIVGELVTRLKNDDDEAVQERCYSELLRLLAPERSDERINLPDEFDRERDVDWSFLEPYLGK